MLITKEELEKLGAIELPNRREWILSKTHDAKYVNPLFMGCCLKYLDFVNSIEDENEKNKTDAINNKKSGYVKYSMGMAFDVMYLYDVMERDGKYDYEYMKDGKFYWAGETVASALDDVNREWVELPFCKGYAVAYTKSEAIALGKVDYKKLPFSRRRKIKESSENDMLQLGAKVIYDRLTTAHLMASEYNRQKALRNKEKTYTKYTTKLTVNDVYQSLKKVGYFSEKTPYDDLIKSGVKLETIDKAFKKYLKEIRNDAERRRIEREDEEFFRDMEMGFFDD